MKPLAKDSHEFNQLKYVCRQLYAETACLELKVSNVAFWGTFDDACRRPARAFSRFLKACSPAKRCWLRSVTLILAEGGDTDAEFIEDPSEFLAVAKFCHENRQSMVEYVACEFTTRTSLRFLTRGTWLMYVFRSVDVPDIVSRDHIHYVYPCTTFVESDKESGELINLLDAPNLRIRPGGNQPCLLSGGKIALFSATFGWTEEQVRIYKDLREDWVKNGI